jgi:HD-GYP domain-containing protein (c-di-GMP phosphodiesterase class II)
MGYIPISVEGLKVGLHIRLDHGWNDHPFLRNSFKINSHTDIGIIRKQGLTKISYDPALSDPQALEALASQSHKETRVNSENESSLSEAELEEATNALQQEKEKLFDSLLTHQDALQETEKAYQNAINQNRAVLKMISMGELEGLDRTKEIVGSMMDILQCPSPTLTLVNTPPPKDITEEVSVHSMNVCTLALLLGQTLNLNQEDMLTLGQGALFFNIGLHRVPSVVRVKQQDDLSTRDRHLLEAYPHYGRQMVEGLKGIPPGSLDIISQHQENLDGSGYPEGLQRDQITFLSKVVRVVTAYYSLLNNGNKSHRLTPNEALIYLYTKMKEKCEPDLIDAFIATVTVYPPGSLVRLTDDCVGLVVKTNKSERLRPLVVLYETVQESGDIVIFDLAEGRDTSIKESLHPRDLDPKILAQLQQTLGGPNGYFVST